MKLPVHVRLFPAEIAVVDACAAALSQQRSGAAFSRAGTVRLNISALSMLWFLASL